MKLNDEKFFIIKRSRHEEEDSPHPRFNTYNEPRHRWFAELITGIEPEFPLTEPNENLARLCGPKRAVIIYYPITEDAKKAKPPYTTGFTLLFPPNDIAQVIKFGVVRRDKPDAITVPIRKAG